MSNESFRPEGVTFLISVSSSTATSPTQTNAAPALYVANPSTVLCFIAIGSSSVQAGNPTTAGVAGLCVPAGSVRVFNAGPSGGATWLSACTTAGSASLYVTAGTGQ